MLAATEPAVLLLDEASSACDVDSVAAVERLVEAAGCAAVWITHDERQAARLGRHGEMRFETFESRS